MRVPRAVLSAAVEALLATDGRAEPLSRRREKVLIDRAEPVPLADVRERDFYAAARAYGAARDLTADKAEQQYLTAAIGDLSNIHIGGPDFQILADPREQLRPR